MIRVLTGENSFALQAELQRVVAEFVVEHGELAVERIDGEEAEYPRITEALSSLPFLADQKLVVLRAPSTNKQFAEKFEQLLAEISETTEVIIVEPKLDKRLVYYKYLKKLDGFQEFAALDVNGLAAWLVAEAKARGGTLSSADARFLVERSGAGQQGLANELEKLLLYEPKISRQSIEQLVEPTPLSTIFNLLEAAFSGNAKRALGLYSEQRALKVEPPRIIAMLAWQLQILAIIKTAGERSASQIASEAKLNPYVVQKSQGIARSLSLARLRELISDLLDIDRRLKRTNLNADDALQHYLLKLAA